MSVQVHVLLNTCKQNITSMSRLVGTTVANTKQKDIGSESFNMHNALKCYTCKCNSTNDLSLCLPSHLLMTFATSLDPDQA